MSSKVSGIRARSLLKAITRAETNLVSKKSHDVEEEIQKEFELSNNEDRFNRISQKIELIEKKINFLNDSSESRKSNVLELNMLLREIERLKTKIKKIEKI